MQKRLGEVETAVVAQLRWVRLVVPMNKARLLFLGGKCCGVLKNLIGPDQSPCSLK